MHFGQFIAATRQRATIYSPSFGQLCGRKRAMSSSLASFSSRSPSNNHNHNKLGNCFAFGSYLTLNVQLSLPPLMLLLTKIQWQNVGRPLICQTEQLWLRWRMRENEGEREREKGRLRRKVRVIVRTLLLSFNIEPTRSKVGIILGESNKVASLCRCSFTFRLI